MLEIWTDEMSVSPFTTRKESIQQKKKQSSNSRDSHQKFKDET
jgi:hypothetical protein